MAGQHVDDNEHVHYDGDEQDDIAANDPCDNDHPTSRKNIETNGSYGSADEDEVMVLNEPTNRTAHCHLKKGCNHNDDSHNIYESSTTSTTNNNNETDHHRHRHHHKENGMSDEDGDGANDDESRRQSHHEDGNETTGSSAQQDSTGRGMLDSNKAKKSSSSIDEQQQMGNQSDDGEGDESPGRTIYVRNLPTHMLSEQVKNYFSRYGEVTDCRIVINPVTKESRGFGFVTYRTPDIADTVIANIDQISIEGRALRVEKARRNRPHDPTPGEYKGPIGASVKYDNRGRLKPGFVPYWDLPVPRYSQHQHNGRLPPQRYPSDTRRGPPRRRSLNGRPPSSRYHTGGGSGGNYHRPGGPHDAPYSGGGYSPRGNSGEHGHRGVYRDGGIPPPSGGKGRSSPPPGWEPSASRSSNARNYPPPNGSNYGPPLERGSDYHYRYEGGVNGGYCGGSSNSNPSGGGYYQRRRIDNRPFPPESRGAPVRRSGSGSYHNRDEPPPYSNLGERRSSRDIGGRCIPPSRYERNLGATGGPSATSASGSTSIRDGPTGGRYYGPAESRPVHRHTSGRSRSPIIRGMAPSTSARPYRNTEMGGYSPRQRPPPSGAISYGGFSGPNREPPPSSNYSSSRW